jgi:hypothetical protein
MHRAVRYDELTVHGGGGDVAQLVDSIYGDTFEGTPTGSIYRTGRSEYLVRDFPTVRVQGEDAGLDQAHLRPSGSEDEVVERADDWLMRGEEYAVLVAKSFGEIYVHGAGAPMSQRLLAPAPSAEDGPQSGISDRDLSLLAHEWYRFQPSSSHDGRESTSGQAPDAVARRALIFHR